MDERKEILIRFEHQHYTAIEAVTNGIIKIIDAMFWRVAIIWATTLIVWVWFK